MVTNHWLGMEGGDLLAPPVPGDILVGGGGVYRHQNAALQCLYTPPHGMCPGRQEAIDC